MRPRRSQLMALACFGAFLVLTPLALEKPGLPMSLRGAEPSHLAAALSVGLDGDLFCEPRDVHRLFQEFPYTPPLRLRLDTTDPTTPVFETDALYALVAALPGRFFGANGLIALNALFFVALLALCGLPSRSTDGKHGPTEGGPGLLFAAVFLVTGTAFLQIFQVGPTLLTALLVALGLRLGLEALADSEPRRDPVLLTGSGLGLGAAAFASPWILAPAVALLATLRRRAWPWLLGLVLGLGMVTTVDVLLSPADEGQVFEIASPYAAPWAEDEPVVAGPSMLGRRAASPAAEAWNRAVFTLFDRRSGLLAYLPGLLPLLAAGLWSLRRRESSLEPAAWLLGLGVAAFIVAQGFDPPTELGAGLVGHPAWVILSPALLLGLKRPPATWVTVAAAALGVLLLGPAQVSTLGGAMAYADGQGHTRGAVLDRLPLDPASVGRAAGYRDLELGGPAELDGRLWIPKYASEIFGDEVWLLGHTRTTLYLTTAKPLDDAVFQVRTLGTPNAIHVDFEGRREALHFPATEAQGSSTRLHFKDLGSRGARRLLETPDGDRDLWLYRLTITSERGFKPNWNGDSHVTFYLGAAVAYLGSQSFLEQDVYGAELAACEAPPEIHAGDEFLAAVKVRNTSSATWPVGGAVEVRLGYRWLDSDGNIVAEGERTDLPEGPVPVGETVASWVQIKAPSRRGPLRLELDPIYENVAWFSHNGVPTCGIDVNVLPPRPKEPAADGT